MLVRKVAVVDVIWTKPGCVRHNDVTTTMLLMLIRKWGVSWLTAVILLLLWKIVTGTPVRLTEGVPIVDQVLGIASTTGRTCWYIMLIFVIVVRRC